MRVLLVEDEAVIAMSLEDMLTDAGHTVVGLAGTVGSAQRMINEHDDIDCAVLDVNLRDETAYPVAALLDSRGVPFIFTSGYGQSGIDGQFADKRVLSKPVNESELIAMLENLIKDRST